MREWGEVFNLIMCRNFSLQNLNLVQTNLEDIENSILDEYSLLCDQKSDMIKISGEEKYKELIETFQLKISSFNKKI
jgi:hypothetical protein